MQKQSGLNIFLYLFQAKTIRIKSPIPKHACKIKNSTQRLDGQRVSHNMNNYLTRCAKCGVFCQIRCSTSHPPWILSFCCLTQTGHKIRNLMPTKSTSERCQNSQPKRNAKITYAIQRWNRMQVNDLILFALVFNLKTPIIVNLNVCSCEQFPVRRTKNFSKVTEPACTFPSMQFKSLFKFTLDDDHSSFVIGFTSNRVTVSCRRFNSGI